MKLSQNQISEIKDFIHSRGFTTIEVEMEILDHVASAIENKLEGNPKKSVTKAIQEVHAGFGPLGFSIMEDEFRKSFWTTYSKIKKSIIQNYFWTGKAHISLGIFITNLILAYLIFPLQLEVIFVIIYGIYFLAALGLYLYFRSMFKKWRKRSLVVASQYSHIGGFGFIFYYSLYFYGEYIFQSATYSPIIFATIVSLIIVFVLIVKDSIDSAFNWTNERYLKYA